MSSPFLFPGRCVQPISISRAMYPAHFHFPGDVSSPFPFPRRCVQPISISQEMCPAHFHFLGDMSSPFPFPGRCVQPISISRAMCPAHFHFPGDVSSPFPFQLFLTQVLCVVVVLRILPFSLTLSILLSTRSLKKANETTNHLVNNLLLYNSQPQFVSVYGTIMGTLNTRARPTCVT